MTDRPDRHPLGRMHFTVVGHATGLTWAVADDSQAIRFAAALAWRLSPAGFVLLDGQRPTLRTPAGGRAVAMRPGSRQCEILQDDAQLEITGLLTRSSGLHRPSRQPGRMERTRLQPGLIERALSRWTAIAKAPKDQLPSPFGDRCGVPECCPEPADERDLPELAIRALPKKSSRELRSIVQPLDLKILERPDAVPYGDPPHRWWRSAF
ncbi:hypothetical protein ACICHK_38885 [Streptomyces sp. AHU1]|uniref:hypothetical protein n=1 Tax=Streptomyces sp. AHU1 TaxID=3377215 RepID=UPI003877E342